MKLLITDEFFGRVLFFCLNEADKVKRGEGIATE